MSEVFELGEITINLTRKSVKNVHLSVHPPAGRVSLVAPTSTRTEVARAYAISKLGWIRLQQQLLRDQARESQRQYIERESHQLWGRSHLLTVVEVDATGFGFLRSRTSSHEPTTVGPTPNRSPTRIAARLPTRPPTPAAARVSPSWSVLSSRPRRA